MFSISLQRNKYKGHNNFLNLGKVEAKVHSEGPDHNQMFVICHDGDKAILRNCLATLDTSLLLFVRQKMSITSKQGALQSRVPRIL